MSKIPESSGVTPESGERDPKPTPMKHRRVLQEWSKFSKALISKSASPAQLSDMQMSFYAGVAILYRIITDLAPGGKATEGDMQMLRDIKAELREFAIKRRESDRAADSAALSKPSTGATQEAKEKIAQDGGELERPKP